MVPSPKAGFRVGFAVSPKHMGRTVRRHHSLVNTVPLCSRRYRYCEVHLLMDGVRKARSRRGYVETLTGRAARTRAAGAVLLARSKTARGARPFPLRAAVFAIWPSARDAGLRGVEFDDGCLFATSGADTPDPGDRYAVTSAATPPAAGGSGPVFATIARNHPALLDSECGDQGAVPERARLAKPRRAAFAMRSGRSTGIRAACKCRGHGGRCFVIWNVRAPGTTVWRVNPRNMPDKVKKLSNVVIPNAAKAPTTRDAAAECRCSRRRRPGGDLCVTPCHSRARGNLGPAQPGAAQGYTRTSLA